MSKTQLLYTGTEAVALAKEYYPETWNQIIEEKQTILKRIQLVSRYMQLLSDEGYQLIDLNISKGTLI